MAQVPLIMVADRNRHVRELLRRELSSRGYGVCIAKDDREVFESISEKTPDLLVLDLELPFDGGMAILSKLKAMGSAIQVVVYSYANDFMPDPSICDVSAFVEKTENTDRLLSVVSELIQKREDGGVVQDSLCQQETGTKVR